MGCTGSITAVQTIDSVPPAPLSSKSTPEQDFHDEYYLWERLGQGGFAVVYAATHIKSGNERLAAKVIDLREASSKHRNFEDEGGRVDRHRQKKFMNETQILSTVSGHDNICRFFARFMQGGLGFIVLDRCDRTLRVALEQCETLNEETLRPFFEGMLTGIAAIHAQCIVHRDIKPDNFMCCGPGNIVKLCDFGLARALAPKGTFAPEDVLEGMENTRIVGSVPFMAPEMLQNEEYCVKVDVWSFGVVAHVLLRGSFPYMPRPITRQSMKEAIKYGVPTPEIFLEASEPHRKSGDMSEAVGYFLISLLSRCPKIRCTSGQALHDEFFTSGSLSRACLRRKLQAAKRFGVFNDFGAKTTIGEVDMRLRRLQQGRCLLGAKARVLQSEVSTEAGSWVYESGRSLETIGTM